MTAQGHRLIAPPVWSFLLRWRTLVALCAVFVLVFPVWSDNLFFQNMIILSLIFAIGAVGLNIISGFGGYVSLGQSAFIGIGAYTVGLMSVHVSGVSPFVWLPLAGVIGALFAGLLGVISMRTRGFSFVIITIAFLFLMQLVAVNWAGLTQGTTGVSLPIPEWDVAYQYWPFYYILYALLALSVLLTWWVRRTKLGMGLIAMREDEDKAATVGINTPTYKMLGFVGSAVFLSMAGGVYAYYLSFIDPLGMFDIIISVQIILSMLLGGRATLWGPVLGAFIIEPVNELANQSLGGGNSRLIIFGALLTLVVLFLPSGIIPTVGGWIDAARRRRRGAIVGERTAAPLVVRERPVPSGTEPDVSDGPLLEIKGLRKRFGGVHAVDGCDFSVARGSIAALIGPNGSGKTTAFNLIDGTMRADGGQVWFDGERIDRLRAWERAHRGLGRTFQITRLFPGMTVLENVVAPLPSFSPRGLGARAVTGPEAARADELLDFVGMRRYRDESAADLSYGQQKLVEIAQVLMLEPKLMLLDEPAGGINPTLIERMAEMIRELNRQGMTFLIVEHNIPLVMGLCDSVAVLSAGRCIHSGSPEGVQSNPAVLDAYLGEDFLAEENVGVVKG